MSASALVEAKNYTTGAVEEEVLAGVDTIPAGTTKPKAVADGVAPTGYDSVLVSVACTRSSSVWLYIAKDGKQIYPNGLATAGLGGLDDETLILKPLKEGEKWEVGFTNTSTSDVEVGWRIRFRHFKK